MKQDWKAVAEDLVKGVDSASKVTIGTRYETSSTNGTIDICEIGAGGKRIIYVARIGPNIGTIESSDFSQTLYRNALVSIFLRGLISLSNDIKAIP